MARAKRRDSSPPKRHKPVSQSRPGPPAAREDEVTGPFPIVGVGASAGGIEAFTQMLQALPSDTGMAFVLIQHLDPSHESMLTDIFSRATDMPVKEVRSRTRVAPDHVYVIPP